MYAHYSHVININGIAPKNAHDYKLKQHHHVKVNKEFKLDIDIWLRFLKSGLTAAVNRPMIDVLTSYLVPSTEVGFYSDASAAGNCRFGIILGKCWIQGFWPNGFIAIQKPSIEFLELYALTVGIIAWNKKLRDGRFCVHCDNKAVVQMINNMMSSCKNCMFLLRLLTLDGLYYNRKLTAFYINTKLNMLTDALSRGQMQRFQKFGAHMETSS